MNYSYPNSEIDTDTIELLQNSAVDTYNRIIKLCYRLFVMKDNSITENNRNYHYTQKIINRSIKEIKFYFHMGILPNDSNTEHTYWNNLRIDIINKIKNKYNTYSSLNILNFVNKTLSTIEFEYYN